MDWICDFVFVSVARSAEEEGLEENAEGRVLLLVSISISLCTKGMLLRGGEV